jgi:hypothetical protein
VETIMSTATLDHPTAAKAVTETPAAPPPPWRLDRFRQPFPAAVELSFVSDGGQQFAVKTDAVTLANIKAVAAAAGAEAEATAEAGAVHELRGKLAALAAERREAADAVNQAEQRVKDAVLGDGDKLDRLEQQLASAKDREQRLAGRERPLKDALVEAERRLAAVRRAVLSDSLTEARMAVDARVREAEAALAEAISGPLAELLAAHAASALVCGPITGKIFA